MTSPPASVSHRGSCSLTAYVGREKAINKGKSSMFVHNPAAYVSICGGWECAVLCTESTNSLDCGCGQQPEECWDFEFLAGLNVPSGLQPLRISGPTKQVEQRQKLSVFFLCHSACKQVVYVYLRSSRGKSNSTVDP